MRLRSLLFVPGDRPERFAKAAATHADALILDLEDAVAPARKAYARDAVAEELAKPRAQTMLVRINALDSGLAAADMECLAACPPDAIVLPKARGSVTLRQLRPLYRDTGCVPVPVLPLAIEDPSAVFSIAEFIGHGSELAGLTWGAEDLRAALGAGANRFPDGAFTPPFAMVRNWLLLAAHAAGVPAIETVYADFRNTEGAARAAAAAARDGFSGMLAIHPGQVMVINAAFTPTVAEIEQARGIIAAFASAPGAGVVALDGRMVDAPHLALALRTLERAGEQAG
jgi:citrate lyase subunit beta / citryl-CoA lyase